MRVGGVVSVRVHVRFTGLLEFIVHPQRLISEALKGEQEEQQSLLTHP